MTNAIPTHAVKAVITNEQNEILFLQRNAAGRADMKSSWDLPGGLVEDGEDDEAALVREIEEETKRKATIGREVGRWTFFRPFDGATVEVTNYAVELDTSDINEIILSPEHVAAKFVARSLLPTLEVKDNSIFEALGQ